MGKALLLLNTTSTYDYKPLNGPSFHSSGHTFDTLSLTASLLFCCLLQWHAAHIPWDSQRQQLHSHKDRQLQQLGSCKRVSPVLSGRQCSQCQQQQRRQADGEGGQSQRQTCNNLLAMLVVAVAAVYVFDMLPANTKGLLVPASFEHPCYNSQLAWQPAVPVAHQQSALHIALFCVGPIKEPQHLAVLYCCARYTVILSQHDDAPVDLPASQLLC